MNKLSMAVWASVAVFAAYGKPFSSNKPFNEMTPEEKAIRYAEARQNRLERFGEELVKPDSQKGRIVFVDACDKGVASEISAVISNVTQRLKYRVESVRDQGAKVTPANATGKRRALGADIAVFAVECADCEDLTLVAPESGWAIVNVAALTKDAKNEAFRTGRIRKALTRAYYSAGGAMNSKYPGSLFGTVTKADDLDRLGEAAPVDVIQRTKDALERRGVTPEIKSFYRRACEQGWAAQPTNDIQRAIWNDVHKLPSSPIRIKYAPKRDK